MIQAERLKTDLQKRLPVLEKALREQAEDRGLRYAAELHAEWRRAKDAGRIAATYEEWRGDQVTQAAVAWLLAMVFLRFCEDNGLIDEPYITGPGDRAAEAIERQHAFFASEEHREESDREWVLAGIRALCDARDTTDNVMRRLFDPAHNPMWLIDPPADAITDLLRFWRERDAAGNLIHNFKDDDWNTRFLGDLYQDLSAHAKEKYALLQTPEFVEVLILKRTLDKAIEEFGLKPENAYGEPGLRLIDPTCGSGHFLLGAFHRILDEQSRRGDSRDINERIADALQSVHGVDKNPFAVAIARFRMALAAMRAEGAKRLADASNFEINVAVGDSLQHGYDAPGRQGELAVGANGELQEVVPHTFRTEDIGEYARYGIRDCDMLTAGTYHVVVGNPPYISITDKQEDATYREGYRSCTGGYVLTIPFAERFFRLGRTPGALDRRGAAYVGQITANSFMKREFGKKLIEEFFRAKVNLTEVIDTSGAFIPAHGTPTVILIGRSHFPNSEQKVHAVRSVRGEPRPPEDPANGLVWRAIAEGIESSRVSNEWVDVDFLDREHYFAHHPWILQAGGKEMVDRLQSFEGKLGELAIRIGFYGDTHSDEAFSLPKAGPLGREHGSMLAQLSHRGDHTRDWRFNDGDLVIFPYDSGKNLLKEVELPRRLLRHMWPLRTTLWARSAFGGGTYQSVGKSWWEWHQLPKDIRAHSWCIAFGEIATHNHFVVDRGCGVFNRTAPVIKLAASASEDEHLVLLGVLNSSTICFWLKQVCQDKPSNGVKRGLESEKWTVRHQFNGANVGDVPLPGNFPLERSRDLDGLARELAACEPSAIVEEAKPVPKVLADAERMYTSTRAFMIALQEELDWDVYRRYGLLNDDEASELIADPADVPEIKLGERAFEIVLARSGAETEWFSRHRSKRVTEIPGHWSEAYRRVVEARIKLIEKRPRTIGLIERPECKRRWLDEPWDDKVKAALRTWLLDRCEDRDLWFDVNGEPKPMTVNRLADKLRGDADVVAVAGLYAGADTDLAKVIADVTASEHVPYLAKRRYKAAGLRKRAQWEKCWELQRKEDATGTRQEIDPPPRYTSADFAKPAYWHNRGKLDVPKERFISYPDAGPPGDRSLLLGWAGWDDAQRAQALIGLADDRVRDDAGRAVIGPIVAGLAEVMPWVEQWHSERDALGTSPASDYAAVLAELRATYGTGEDSSG